MRAPHTSRPILILLALRTEARPLLRSLSDPRHAGAADLRARIGRIEGRPVAVAISGVGAARMRRAARRAIDAFGPAAIVGAGFACALDPELAPGALVVATRLLDRTGPETRAFEPAPVPAAVLPEACRGSIATIAHVASPAETARLRRETGAIAADMESAAIAAAAGGIPVRVVRAITDAAGEALHVPYGRMLDRGGRPSLLRLAAHTLAHPRSAAAIARDARRARRAARALAGAIATLLEAG